MSSTKTLGATSLLYVVVEPKTKDRELFKIQNATGSTAEYTLPISLRGLREYGDDVEVPANKKRHGVGSDVIISDNHNYLAKVIAAFNAHEDLIEAHGWAGTGLLADRPSAASNDNKLYFATDELVMYYSNGTSWLAQSAGTIADASTGVKGGVFMSVAPDVATSPTAVGTNDPRILTLGNKNELTGGGTTTLHKHEFVTGGIKRTRYANIQAITVGAPLDTTTGHTEIDEASSATLNITGTTTYQYAAQRLCFTDTLTGISALSTYLKYAGSPTDNLLFRIETETAGAPSGTLADANAVGTISYSDMSSSISVETISFSGTFTLSAATNYWLKISRTGTASTTNYFAVDQTTTTYYGGSMKSYNGTSYTTESYIRYLNLSYDGVRKHLPSLKLTYSRTCSGSTYTSTYSNSFMKYGNSVYMFFGLDGAVASGLNNIGVAYVRDTATQRLIPGNGGTSFTVRPHNDVDNRFDSVSYYGVKFFPNHEYLLHTYSAYDSSAPFNASAAVGSADTTGACSVGTPQQLYTTSVSFTRPPRCGVDTTGALILYQETVGNQTKMKAVTYSSTTLDAPGSESTLNSSANKDFHIVCIGSGKYLTHYNNGTNDVFQVVTVSGTTISTNSTTVAARAYSHLVSPYEADAATSDVAYAKNGTTLYKITVSGTSVTTETLVQESLNSLGTATVGESGYAWMTSATDYYEKVSTTLTYLQLDTSNRYNNRTRTISTAVAASCAGGGYAAAISHNTAGTVNTHLYAAKSTGAAFLANETVTKGSNIDIVPTGVVESTGSFTAGDYYIDSEGVVNTTGRGNILGAGADVNTFVLRPANDPYINQIT